MSKSQDVLRQVLRLAERGVSAYADSLDKWKSREANARVANMCFKVANTCFPNVISQAPCLPLDRQKLCHFSSTLMSFLMHPNVISQAPCLPLDRQKLSSLAFRSCARLTGPACLTLSAALASRAAWAMGCGGHALHRLHDADGQPLRLHFLYPHGL